MQYAISPKFGSRFCAKQRSRNFFKLFSQNLLTSGARCDKMQVSQGNSPQQTRKETETMTTYTISKNEQFNSLEISFDSKPDEKIREVLKALKFRWHNLKKVWYGYAEETALKAALNGNTTETAPAKTAKTEKVNKYGVKVGDIFSASWGYEQTNVDFFQVIALVGECSVRVREVHPQMIDEKPTCSMAADRTYKLTNEILPAASRSVFIKDQENGDLKRIKPGYHKDPEQANKYCYFTLDTFATAHKCNGDTVTEYESWYA